MKKGKGVQALTEMLLAQKKALSEGDLDRLHGLPEQMEAALGGLDVAGADDLQLLRDMASQNARLLQSARDSLRSVRESRLARNSPSLTTYDRTGKPRIANATTKRVLLRR